MRLCNARLPDAETRFIVSCRQFERTAANDLAALLHDPTRGMLKTKNAHLSWPRGGCPMGLRKDNSRNREFRVQGSTFTVAGCSSQSVANSGEPGVCSKSSNSQLRDAVPRELPILESHVCARSLQMPFPVSLPPAVLAGHRHAASPGEIRAVLTATEYFGA